MIVNLHKFENTSLCRFFHKNRKHDRIYSRGLRKALKRKVGRPMTDAEFQAAIEKIRQGNRSGLKDIYDSYGNMIYCLFLSRVHSREDAEDLTSDYFLKLWTAAESYRPGTGHRCWMGTIARNMAVDHIRRRSREVPVEDELLTAAAERMDSGRTEPDVLEKMHASQLLTPLADDEREIVQLHLAAELTFREIAVILKRPLGTVAYKYRCAIGKLKKIAEEGGFI